MNSRLLIKDDDRDQAAPRRVPGLRNRRRREEDELDIREIDQDDDGDDGEEEDDEDGEDEGLLASSGRKKRIGAKKQAKLDAKQQRKQQVAALEQMREERKRIEQAREQRRLEEEAEEERKRKAEEEEDERRRQLAEKKQQEEYDEWKNLFAVEEKGEEALGEAERAQQVLDLIEFCKTSKVVLLEDLASNYKMKTAQILELLAELDADRRLTGVVDDRGKFFFISSEEYEQVARFIERRGRISMDELTVEWFAFLAPPSPLVCFAPRQRTESDVFPAIALCRSRRERKKKSKKHSQKHDFSDFRPLSLLIAWRAKERRSDDDGVVVWKWR